MKNAFYHKPATGSNGQTCSRSVALWQWPNVLAIDAALIAVFWQAALAAAMDLPLSMVAHLVLGLSVWLTYTADRLVDVAQRDASTLLSARHRFVKRQRVRLWRIGLAGLIVNLVAATQLTGTQLKQGGGLLLFCLLYTFLNQKLSRRFFPKELCVALIYAVGVVILLPESPPCGFLALFTCLCLLNCLMIGKKETRVDAHLHVHSMAGKLRESSLTPLIWLGATFTFFIATPLRGALLASFILLGLLHALRARFPKEVFRVLADGVLLLGPLFALVL